MANYVLRARQIYDIVVSATANGPFFGPPYPLRNNKISVVGDNPGSTFGSMPIIIKSLLPMISYASGIYEFIESEDAPEDAGGPAHSHLSFRFSPDEDVPIGWVMACPFFLNMESTPEFVAYGADTSIVLSSAGAIFGALAGIHESPTFFRSSGLNADGKPVLQQTRTSHRISSPPTLQGGLNRQSRHPSPQVSDDESDTDLRTPSYGSAAPVFDGIRRPRRFGALRRALDKVQM